MTSLRQADPAQRQRLRRLWDHFLALLETAAVSGDLAAAIEGALHVDRSSSVVQNYLSQLLAEGAKDLESLPGLALGDAQEMTGAAGAYVGDLNLILINSSWLAGASDAEVIKVMAEEYGHSLDALFNTQDTAGDEGERFALQLLGYEAPAESAFENDTITVTVNGVNYAAEAATASLGNTATVYRNTSDGTNTTAQNDDITINTATATHTIYSGGGTDRIFLAAATTRMPLVDPGAVTTSSPAPGTGTINPTIQARTGREIFIVNGANALGYVSGRTTSNVRSLDLTNYPQIEAGYIKQTATSAAGWILTSATVSSTAVATTTQPRQILGGSAARDTIEAKDVRGNTVYTNAFYNATATVQGGDDVRLGNITSHLVQVNVGGPTEDIGGLSFAALSATNTTSVRTSLKYTLLSTLIKIGSNKQIINLPDFGDVNKVTAQGYSSIQQILAARDRGIETGIPWAPLNGKSAWLPVLITDLQNGILKAFLVTQVYGSKEVEVLELKKSPGSAVDITKAYDQIYLNPNLVSATQAATPGAPIAAPDTVDLILPAANRSEDTQIFIKASDFGYDVPPDQLLYDWEIDANGDGAIDTYSTTSNKPSPIQKPTASFSSTGELLGWNFQPEHNDDSDVIFLAKVGGSFQQRWKLDIAPVNDTPVATFTTLQNATEDGSSITGYLTSDDVDRLPTSTQGDTARYEQVTTVEGLTIVPNAPTVAQTVTPNAYAAQWTFDPTNAAYQYLAKDQTTSRTVTYKVTDSGPLPDSSDDLSATTSFTIFITGTNDTPVVNAISQTNLNEQTDTSALTASIPVTFSDVDLTDVGHTATITAVTTTGTTTGLALDANALKALINPGTVAKTSGSSSGSLNLAFSAAYTAFDYLAKDEVLTLTYTLSINDLDGGVSTKTFDVVITGTNDAAVINAIIQTNLNEQTNTSPLTASIPVTFTDVDLTDVGHTATITAVTTTGTTTGLALDANALKALINPGTVAKTSGSSSGSLNLAFSAAYTAFDYLAKDEVLTLTYTLSLNDSDGGITTKDFTVTITGTNDTPDISVGAGDANAAFLSVGNADLSSSGTLTVRDPDLSNTVALITSVVKSGTTTGITFTDTQLAGMLSLNASSLNANPSDSSNLTWSFNALNNAFDYLAAGQTLVLTYTITATDNAVATDNQTLVVTITNGRPTLTISLGENLPLTGQNFSTPITFQFSEAVNGFDASDVTMTNGALSNFQVVSGNPTQYTAVFTATNFDSSTGSVAVSANYTDLEGNSGYAASATLGMTVGGGVDPNDVTLGGSTVTTTGNTTTGTTNGDTIARDNGVDSINGGAGNDSITSGNANDSIYAGAGNDTAAGGKGIDFVYGGSGDDTLYGDETIAGNDSGGDLLIGGFGKDNLTGGGGSDEFRFLSLYDQGDVISDFSGDKIVFDTTGSATQFAFTALAGAGKTYTQAIADGTLVFNDTNDTLSYDHDGTTGTAWTPITIVTVTNATSTTFNNDNVQFLDIA